MIREKAETLLEMVERLQPLSNRVLCNAIRDDGAECEEEAVIQYLPDGDDARCLRHLRR